MFGRNHYEGHGYEQWIEHVPGHESNIARYTKELVS